MIREVVVELRAVTSGFLTAMKDVLADMGRVSIKLGELQQAATQTGQEFAKSLAAAARSTQDLNLSIAQTTYVFQRLGTVAGAFGAAFLGGITLALRGATEFEETMRNINTLLRLSEESIGDLSKKVMDLSTAVPQGPNVLARSLYEIISTGFEGADALRLLEVSAKAASAGITSADLAVRSILTVLKAYNLTALESARVSDVMFRAIDVGRFTFKDLAEQMGDFIALAAQMGVSLEEALAALAAMTLKGIQTSEAATSLAAVFRELINPTKELDAFIRNLGFTTAQSAIQQLGFVEVIKKIAEETGGSTKAIQALFNEARALRGILPLVSNNASEFVALLEKIRRSSGATQVAFEEQAKSFAFQFAIMRNNLTAFFQNALLPALPVLSKAAEMMAGLSRTALDLSRSFPILTSAITALTAVFAVLSGVMGGLLVTAAPIILLMNTQLVPAMGNLAVRLASVINLLTRIINLKVAGVFILGAVALELFNRVTGGAVDILRRMVGEFMRFSSAVSTGSKTVQQASSEMKFNIAETALSVATRDIPLIRRSVQEFVGQMEQLRRQAMVVREARDIDALIAKVNELTEAYKRTVRAKSEMLGLPEAAINNLMRAMDSMRRAVIGTAEASRINLQKTISELSRMFEASARWTRGIKISFGDMVANIEDLPQILRSVPEQMEQLRRGVQEGVVTLEQADAQVLSLIQNFKELADQISKAFTSELAAPLFQVIQEVVFELEKFRSVLGQIKPQKVVVEGEKETVEDIRKEFEEINRLRRQALELSISQINLEFAQRFVAARRADELIFLEEQRNRRILEINQKANQTMLTLINDLMERMARAIGAGGERLAELNRKIAEARTDEERRALEKEKQELVAELSRRNEEFARLESERVNILAETNNMRARLMEEGARRVVAILEELRNEGIQIERDIFRTVVEIAEESIRIAEQIGGRPRIPSVFEGLIEITTLEGSRLIEKERNILSARLELFRSQEELRLAILRRVTQSEINELTTRMRILEMTVETENRLRQITIRMMEDETRASLDELRRQTEEQIAQIERMPGLPRRRREELIQQIRMRALEEERRLTEELERRKLEAELASIRERIELERIRIDMTRRRGEMEMRLAEEEARNQISMAELQTRERIAQIQFELRMRENQTRASIMMAQLEAESRIAQARLELETKLRLIEAEVRARLAAGQITAEQATAILSQINQVRQQFLNFEQAVRNATRQTVEGLLRGLEQERQETQSIIGLLNQQLDLRRQIINEQLKQRREEIGTRIRLEQEQSRLRMRELERERERIDKLFRLRGFAPSFDQVAFRVEDVGERIATSFSEFGSQIVESARSVAQAIKSIEIAAPVVAPTRVRAAELEEARVANIINVEGTEVVFTPDEERLFINLMRRLIGPEGRRLFDEWARRGV